MDRQTVNKSEADMLTTRLCNTAIYIADSSLVQRGAKSHKSGGKIIYKYGLTISAGI
jgi:hypothetical protein